MTNGFWADGMGAYQAGLRETYDALLDDLRSQLGECTDEERAEFESEIEQVEAEYRDKLEKARNHLY